MQNGEAVNVNNVNQKMEIQTEMHPNSKCKLFMLC